MKIKPLVLAALTSCGISAHAADSINLGSYQVTGTYALDLTAGTGGVSGLEGSAITYARDLGTLFYVGDEGTGVIEISRTGQTLGAMSFDWTGTASTNHDTEGLTYLGGGVLVVAEERLYDAYRVNYTAGGSAVLANSYVSISNAVVGNNGLEGISVDPRDGSFVSIKQQSPQDILAGGLTFSATGGTSTMTQLFNPALMNVVTLSDVQTLSPVDALAGTAAADNLLVLSLGSRSLIEVNRLGQVKSVFDLSGVLAHNAIEGVTVDENGTIYLIAEQVQDGSDPIGVISKSQLIVLTSAVPEANAYAMFLAGFSSLGLWARRRKAVSRPSEEAGR